MAALALALLGVLLFLEVIRPSTISRSMGRLRCFPGESGGPLSLATLWLSGRSFILSAASLSVNVMLLLAALLVLWLIGHSNFAWH
jgi:hypothetical protein